jgi:tetratricopeptide (TPR) repeat protein
MRSTAIVNANGFRRLPGIEAVRLSLYSRRMRSKLTAAAVLGVFLLLSGCATGARGSVASDYYNIGNAYEELGKYDKAIQYYQDALRADPGMVKADFNLAISLARMKRTDEAAAVLKRLLLNDPPNTQLIATLGWVYHLAGRDGDALEQYDAVLTLSPADQDSLYNSGIILWKVERKEEALERFRKVLVNAPNDTDALYAAGSLLLSMDKPAGSADMLSRYLEKKPDDAQAWYLVAAGAERMRKYSRALEAYEKIIAKDPKQSDAWFGEARLLLTVIEDPQRGLDSLSKALAGGFKDTIAVKALLDSSELRERGKVEGMLKERNLLPEAPPAAAKPPG